MAVARLRRRPWPQGSPGPSSRPPCSRTRSSACPSSLYVPLPQRGMPRTVHSMEKPYVFGAVAILQPPGDLLIYHQAKPFELRIDRSASTNAKPSGLPCDRRRELRATRSSCSILTADPKRASVPSRCPCMSSMLGFKHKYCGCLIADRLGGDRLLLICPLEHGADEALAINHRARGSVWLVTRGSRTAL